MKDLEKRAREYLVDNDHITMLGTKAEIYIAGYNQCSEDNTDREFEIFKEAVLELQGTTGLYLINERVKRIKSRE